MFIVTKCDRIKAERDGNNNASMLNAPFVVPHELIKVVPQHFILDVLNVYGLVLIISSPKKRSTRSKSSNVT